MVAMTNAPRRTVQVWRWSWTNNIALLLMQFVAAGVLQHLAPAWVNASSVGTGHTSKTRCVCSTRQGFDADTTGPAGIPLVTLRHCFRMSAASGERFVAHGSILKMLFLRENQRRWRSRSVTVSRCRGPVFPKSLNITGPVQML